MTHEHNIVDSDVKFTIDPKTRSISNPSRKITLIQYDHNSERFGFRLPRFVEGHDMAESTSIQIHYINIGSGSENNSGVYAVTDAGIDPENPDMMLFSWLISSNCTQFVGSLAFAVRFSCVNNGITEYSWGTSSFSGMNVASSIQNTETVVMEHADIIAAWEARISEIEKSHGTPDMSAYLSKEEASQLYQPLNTDDGVLTMVVESGLIDPVSSNTGELYITSNDEVFVL